MQTVYLRNTFDNGEPRSNMAQKKQQRVCLSSLRVYLSLLLSGERESRATVLKDFACRRVLVQQKFSLAIILLFVFVYYARGKIDRLLCILSS